MSCRLVNQGGVDQGAMINSLGQRRGVHASLPLPSSCRHDARMIGVRLESENDGRLLDLTGWLSV
jgi:hypothetical protein